MLLLFLGHVNREIDTVWFGADHGILKEPGASFDGAGGAEEEEEEEERLGGSAVYLRIVRRVRATVV
jgi:hypothetical protein